MRTLHVFVNRQGDVVATCPAPTPLAGKPSGPIFAGLGPASGANELKAFELSVEDDFKPARGGKGVDEFHAKVAERIRTGNDAKPIDVRTEPS